jgi:hypothetical protein
MRQRSLARFAGVNWYTAPLCAAPGEDTTVATTPPTFVFARPLTITPPVSSRWNVVT